MINQFHQIWETIAEDIKGAIIRGELRPNQKLKIQELSAQYGVSNTPIREVFRYLADRGFVEIIPRKMVLVKEITLKEIEDIYAIQTVLESLSARLAAMNCSDKNMKILDRIFEQLEVALAEKMIEKYMRMDDKFHQALINFSNNERLAFILENTRDQIARFRNILLRTPGRMEASMREHRRLFAAVKARDEEGADLAMREQNQASFGLLRKHLNQKDAFQLDEALSRTDDPHEKDDFSGQKASITNDND